MPNSSTPDCVDMSNSFLNSFEQLEKRLYAYEETYSFEEYETENTPICFSNDSPLSSMSFEMINGESQSPSSDGFLFPDQFQDYFTEGTPICFSHDSPLSSMSLNMSFEKQDLQGVFSFPTSLDSLNKVEKQSELLDVSDQSSSLLHQQKLSSNSLLSSRHSLSLESGKQLDPLPSALSNTTDSISSRQAFESVEIVAPRPPSVLSCDRKSTFGNLSSSTERIELASSPVQRKISVEKAKEQAFTEQLSESLNVLSKHPDYSSRVPPLPGNDQQSKPIETFEGGFDENEDFDQFYLNHCINSGRSAMKDNQQQELSVESEKMEKIIAPFMSLDLGSKVDQQPSVFKGLHKESGQVHSGKHHHHYHHHHRQTTRETQQKQQQQQQFTHALPVTRPKQLRSDAESVITDFSEKFNDGHMSRSRYKIDGQESGLHYVEGDVQLSSDVHPIKLVGSDDISCMPVNSRSHHSSDQDLIAAKSLQHSESAQCESSTNVSSESVIRKKGIKKFLKLFPTFSRPT